MVELSFKALRVSELDLQTTSEIYVKSNEITLTYSQNFFQYKSKEPLLYL